MNRILKKIVILLTVISLLTVPCATCFAQDMKADEAVSTGRMIGDALVARPLGICATVVGSGLFVIALPFSLLGGNTGETFDSLMAAPFKFTFSRPLGDF